MHKALYRKWRPETFSDVCGQEHITTVLAYEVQHERLSHAYLFCGSRGTGKTSCAKILAKAVNCENPNNGNPCGHCRSCIGIENGSVTDVVEMDAASNNGVDDIRGIRDDVVYLPSSVKYRVYIIDEVHMLSSSAFNALLKTLEEPPAHVIFILATTEQQKLPATIVSRCQRFDFRRLTIDAIVGRLNYIAKEEGYELDGDAAQLIASLARGGMRDAVSMLELAAGMSLQTESGKLSSHITEQAVLDVSGMTGRRTLVRLVNAVLDSDLEAIFEITGDLYNSSRDISVFWRELIDFYRDMLIVKTTKKAQQYLDLTDAEMKTTMQAASRFRSSALINHISLLDKAYGDMQRSGESKRSCAEFTLVKMTDPSYTLSTDALIDRIVSLEEKVDMLTRELNSGSNFTGMPDGISKKKSSDAIAGDIVEQKKETDIASHEFYSENGEQNTETPDEQTVFSESQTESLYERADIRENTRPDGRRVLYNLSCWDDAVNEYIGQDVSMFEILRMAKGYRTDDGCMVIKTKGQFIASMLSDPNVSGKLLSIVSGKDKRVKSVSVEITSAEHEKDFFDDFEQAQNGDE